MMPEMKMRQDAQAAAGDHGNEHLNAIQVRAILLRIYMPAIDRSCCVLRAACCDQSCCLLLAAKGQPGLPIH